MLKSIYSAIIWFYACLTIVIVALLTFLTFPITLFFDKKRMLASKIVYYWSKIILGSIPLWKYEISGLENIEKNKTYIIVANHQSLADILFMNLLNINFKYVAKIELFKIPIFGQTLRLVGYIPLKRGNKESIEKCILKAKEWLRKDVSILFFPEGTRSKTGEIGKFKSGAFRMAKEEKINILPVTICGTKDLIAKHSWKANKAFVKMVVQKPIQYSEIEYTEYDKIKDDVRSMIIMQRNKITT